MLAPEEETDAEVTWEDQKAINAFGRLTKRRDEAITERRKVELDLERLGEVEEELMLADLDDGKVMFKVGESFLHLTSDEATEEISRRQADLRKQVDEFTEEESSLSATLAGLKKKLYAKFGSSINLEDGRGD